MTNGAGRLPDVLVAGAQKAGTTWLMRYLSRHPDVFCPPKEVDFFSNGEIYSRGVEWYREQFSTARTDQITAEKSPGYLYINSGQDFSAGIPARLHALIPEVKLIFTLREPVSRLVSALNHQIEKRRLSPGENFDQLLKEEMELGPSSFGFVHTGLYADQISAYQALFPTAQIRIYLYDEDIAKNPDATLKDVSDFIGVPLDQQEETSRRANRRMNTRAAQYLNHHVPVLGPAISAIDRLLPRQRPIGPSAQCFEALHAFYAPEIDRLETLINRDLSHWRMPLSHG